MERECYYKTDVEEEGGRGGKGREGKGCFRCSCCHSFQTHVVPVHSACVFQVDGIPNSMSGSNKVVGRVERHL